MKLYYQDDVSNKDSIAHISLSGERHIKGDDLLVLATWVFDTETMMSNGEVNHLEHVMLSGTPMFVEGEVGGYSTKAMTLRPVEKVSILKDMSCFKVGNAIIIFQLEKEV